jgi:hypothetical protein
MLSTRTRWLFVLVFLFIAQAPLLCQAVSKLPSFKRVDLNRPLSFVNSGAWSSDGETLFLADTHNFEIIPIPLNETKPSLEPRTVNKWKELIVSGIGPSHLGIAIKTERPEPRLHIVDDNLESIDMFPLDELIGNGKRVSKFYNWTFSPDGIYAFADTLVEDSRGRHVSQPEEVGNFIKISPSQKGGSFTHFLDIRTSLADPLRTFYRLGLNLFTHSPRYQSNQEAFALIMDRPMYIVRLSGRGAERLPDITEICGDRPAIPDEFGIDGMYAAYKALEALPGPIGIYAAGDSLFLLCRQRDENRLNHVLYEINKITGDSAEPILLDTSAANLTVVPGPTYWAFVEKDHTRFVSPEIRRFEALARSVFFIKVSDLGASIIKARKEKVVPEPTPEPLDLWLWLFGGLGATFVGFGFKKLATVVSRRVAQPEKGSGSAKDE